MRIQNVYDRFIDFFDRFDHGPGQYDEARVKARSEYRSFTRKTNFMTVEDYNNFQSEYAGKRPSGFVKYSSDSLPEGYYKVGWFGKLYHPESVNKFYLPTRVYFLYQLKSTLDFAKGAMGGAGVELSLTGILLFVLFAILFFVSGLLIRFPLAILLTLVQFVLSRIGK